MRGEHHLSCLMSDQKRSPTPGLTSACMQQPFLSDTLHVPTLKVLSEQDHLREFEFSRFHSCIAFQFKSS